jgi:mannose-6-phosphate isomerase-like protein (cupin superfamily)
VLSERLNVPARFDTGVTMSTSPRQQVVATPEIRTGVGDDPWRRASSRALHPSQVAAGIPLLTAIAEGLAAVAVPWELSTGSQPSERCFEQLLSTESYDAWLIHWPPGTGVEAHDHGGSSGAVAVVAGELTEEVHRAGGGQKRHLGPGESVTFGGEHVHTVDNRGACGATSVHVYSPPLRAMGFYEANGGGRRTRARVEEI